jgi:hypothetical protein
VGRHKHVIVEENFYISSRDVCTCFFAQQTSNYVQFLFAKKSHQSGMKTNDKSCEVIQRAIQAGSQIAVDIKDNFCK